MKWDVEKEHMAVVVFTHFCPFICYVAKPFRNHFAKPAVIYVS